MGFPANLAGLGVSQRATHISLSDVSSRTSSAFSSRNSHDRSRRTLNPLRGSDYAWTCPLRGHAFVQAQFLGQQINRRKLYPTKFRHTLEQNDRLRVTADYAGDRVTEIRSARATRRAEEFVGAEHPVHLDART